MRILLVLAIVWSFCDAQDSEQCQISDEILANILPVLGSCNRNGTRQVKFKIRPGNYSCLLNKPSSPALTVPASVEHNICSIGCPPGSVLTISKLSAADSADATDSSTSACQICPENTYSVGGGSLIQNWGTSSSSQEPVPLPSPFETACAGFNESRFYIQFLTNSKALAKPMYINDSKTAVRPSARRGSQVAGDEAGERWLDERRRVQPVGGGAGRVLPVIRRQPARGARAEHAVAAPALQDRRPALVHLQVTPAHPRLPYPRTRHVHPSACQPVVGRAVTCCRAGPHDTP